MLENVKIFTTDEYWQYILSELGATVTDSQKNSDVIFDEIDIDSPVPIRILQKKIFDSMNNTDVIIEIFGRFVVLPTLQHKIVVALYKNPDISIQELKNMVGLLPDVTSHTVENAIYQLRKKYGCDFIVNENGKYKIGRV